VHRSAADAARSVQSVPASKPVSRRPRSDVPRSAVPEPDPSLVGRMTMIEDIDSKQLESVSGGVRPGPNGEGCTGPCFPRPRPPIGPRPNPLDGVTDPLPNPGLR